MVSGKDEPGNAAYAGRWVARVEGRIVAQAHTAEEAREAAQLQRHKEKVEISFTAGDPGALYGPLLQKVVAVAGTQVIYLVGGAVRDAILGRESHDFDFTVQSDAISLARRVANSMKADFYVLDEQHEAARVIISQEGRPRDVLDFTSFRGADLAADLAGRDFTVNAVAYSLADRTILDPMKGGVDLRAGTLRACADSSMRDDPVRVVRAIRLAAALHFRIENDTRAALKDAARLLPNTSVERIRDELFKILGGPNTATALRALEIIGTLPYILPELVELKGTMQSGPHQYDVWAHTLNVIDHLHEILGTLMPGGSLEKGGLLAGLLSGKLGRYRDQMAAHFEASLTPDRSARSLLFFAALYHDVAKPAAKSTDASGRAHFLGHEIQGAEAAAQRGQALRLSNGETEYASFMVRHHMRFPELAYRTETKRELPSRKAIFRFFRDAGSKGVDLILLGLADLSGSRGPTLTDRAWTAFLETARLLLENYWDKPQESVSPPRLVDGAEIMEAYGLPPSQVVGRLLQAIQEAQAAGSIQTRAQAIEFGRTWLKSRQ